MTMKEILTKEYKEKVSELENECRVGREKVKTKITLGGMPHISGEEWVDIWKNRNDLKINDITIMGFSGNKENGIYMIVFIRFENDTTEQVYIAL